MKNLKWALLMSGWGRSAQKALELQSEDRLGKNEISLIICESEENGVMELASKLKVPVIMLTKKQFDTNKEYYHDLYNKLKSYQIDYIFLLGYKHILKEPMLSWYKNKIVNIHPSLLPAFRGKKAIQQAMNYGVKITGITTHLIDAEVDRGIILCQRCIRLSNDEPFDKLDERFIDEGKLIIEETFKQIQNINE